MLNRHQGVQAARNSRKTSGRENRRSPAAAVVLGWPLLLVVEGEPLLLLMAGDFVGDAGLEPIFASNADDAVRIFEGREDVAIVFTDVRMPGSMDGIKLAAAVRDRVASDQARGCIRSPRRRP